MTRVARVLLHRLFFWSVVATAVAGLCVGPLCNPTMAAPTIIWRASPISTSCSGPTDGAGNAWYHPAFDDSSWSAISLPAHNDIPGSRTRFYRGTFVPGGLANATISFDSDDGIDVYVNNAYKGHWGGNCFGFGCVGNTGGCSGSRINLDISADLIPGETNLIAVAVENGSGGSYMNTYFTSFLNTSPPLDLIQPVQNGFCRRSCTFIWAEPPSDFSVAKYVLRVDGAVQKNNIPPTIQSYTLTVSEQLSEGVHAWTIQACDSLGTCTQSPNTFTVNVDATPPAPFALTAPDDLAWKSGNSAFSFQWAPTSDGASPSPSGLDHYDLTIDGQVRTTVPAAETNASSFTFGVFSALTNGTHTWSASAVDKVGNSATAPARTVRIDSTAPVFPAFSPAPAHGSYITNQMPTVQWQIASDTESGLARQGVYLDSFPVFDPGLAASSFTFPMKLADGLHHWSVLATDQAGNSSSTNLFSFLVDTTAPTGLRLNGLSPGTADGAIVSSLTPQICWTGATDAVSGVVGYRLYFGGTLIRDNITVSSTCTTPPSALTDGAYQWYIEAFDKVGNTARSLETFTFYVDTQPPTSFMLVSPPDQATITGSLPTFSWLASSDVGSGLANYEVWIDSGAGGQCAPCIVAVLQTAFVPLVPLTIGPHTWFVKAVDVAGRKTQSAVSSFGVVATPTATRTATQTPTPTRTFTATPSNTSTATVTATSTPTGTPTPTGTRSNTPTVTATPSSTPTLSATLTQTFTATPSVTASSTGTRTATPSQTPTATATATPTQTLTATPSATFTATPTPTVTGTATLTTSPTATGTQTPTAIPTATATITPTYTATPTPSASATGTPTATATASPSRIPTPTATGSPSPTRTPISCAGNCDQEGDVTVNDIITMVNIALGNANVSACAAGDIDGSGDITINEIIAAVNNALNGCELARQGNRPPDRADRAVDRSLSCGNPTGVRG